MMIAETLVEPLPLSAAARQLLDEYVRESGADVRVWYPAAEDWRAVYPEDSAAEPPAAESVRVTAPKGSAMRLLVRRSNGEVDEPAARFLGAVLVQLVRHEAEVGFFSRELAERYEEITLLYSISEILASVISLKESASIILSEVVDALGARRAALWVHDAAEDHLDLVAAVGGDGQGGPVEVGDPESLTAAVFRERRPMILSPGDEFPRRESAAYPRERGAFLSVPVSFTPQDGEPRTIGVINLIGRRSDEAFSAGDQKLLSAIASQIGAAVENRRLVDESLRQERIVREMELAHDLQLKLLPPLDEFEGYADVVARCAPAESVGGDFYHLFRLPQGCIGVMIGDVSTHGFSAALIMALTMSAVAIHAAETDSPGEVLRRTHRALIDELQSTEMYLTLFYGVIDPDNRKLTYANAGHPHAFRIAASGTRDRLGATNPPIGLVDADAYPEASTEWEPGRDVLLLFTDGLSDAITTAGKSGEDILLEALNGVADTPLEQTLERLFALTGRDHDAPPVDDRTAVLLRI